MKRPGGKERAGGPESRIQNRQKIPCMLPMNRVEDIHIPCTVERMKKGPQRSRSLLVQKIMRARLSNAETSVGEIDRMVLESLGWRVGRKSQVVSRTEDDVPPVGSDDEPTSQCPLRRAGGREGRLCAM